MSQERGKEFAQERMGLLEEVQRGRDDVVVANRELDAHKKSLAEVEAKLKEAEDQVGRE